jgi:hypothetical protein
MSDRLKGCWVAFERDIKDEDAEPIMEAIRYIRGVQAVDASVTDSDDWLARQHIKADVREKLLALYKDL